MQLNDLLEHAIIDVYAVREKWFGVEHDSPCMGAKLEPCFFNEIKSVYLLEQNAGRESC